MGWLNGPDLVPRAGIEPARPLLTKRRILSPLCLPISPPRQTRYYGTSRVAISVPVSDRKNLALTTRGLNRLSYKVNVLDDKLPLAQYGSVRNRGVEVHDFSPLSRRADAYASAV